MALGKGATRKIEGLYRELHGRLRGEVLRDVPLSGYTTFRIGGPADLLVVPKGQEELFLLSQAILDHGCDFLVLGRGSNVLVSDAGFRGVVVLTPPGLKRARIKDEGKVNIESGCELNRLILWCMEHGLAGLEELSGIPGSIGGAVRMNAGAHGRTIGDIVEEIKVLRLEGEEIRERTLSARKACFAYRRARGIGNRDIIYEVKLNLYIDDKDRIRERRDGFLSWRKERQPLGRPSAGSVFLNPPGMSAGEIIERCGLKGMRVGDAMVSPKHANFIVNLGKASADDVLRLVELIKREVLRKEGVELEEEIDLIGFGRG
ncbi:UDP-N-acetylmuramate dehydrogenase [Candidatus Solincola tengchongensis]|uniref:UDP-N-acetylmuramate dehydrogenase n=1 Tax=Candidatus Solincola tengchongensis TaxID=2900693 RepID=UPI00257BF4BB|nr:UDP-N-acetylmuramate dehydrogenase [Candidatus Solincola tengchongensis]